MNQIQSIRKRLGVTQAALAAGIKVTQSNVSHYEKGQSVPPDVAGRLIVFASSVGVSITFNDIYGHQKASKSAARGKRGPTTNEASVIPQASQSASRPSRKSGAQKSA